MNLNKIFPIIFWVLTLPTVCKLNKVAICEGSSYVIKCPQMSMIHVQNALYSCFDNGQCLTSQTASFNSCISNNVTDYIQKLCNRNNSCVIESNDNVFGFYSCLTTWKYTIVDYICYLDSSIFVGEINKYTNTTLEKFYDEFVISFLLLSTGLVPHL
ncbi:L-rhamnose-binding lectin ELEL-1 [Hydra vulgaris]|uniref:L-rhamnose-binding lectin ELEL-1 n=1 Tax=Hydra vulgaris TaxID=6087 RepID=UPI001F5E7462|nr:L-rhamnose-binding lectin ELEL-1-like [Hydra vulgaris]